jgi:hypothetical protein
MVIYRLIFLFNSGKDTCLIKKMDKLINDYENCKRFKKQGVQKKKIWDYQIVNKTYCFVIFIAF